jgi:O-antigen ligase
VLVTSKARSEALPWLGSSIVGAWSAGSASARRMWLPGIAAAGALLIVAPAALALSQSGVPSLGIAVGAGLALVGLVTVALASYDAAVVLGVVLLGVVRKEPALPDLIFAVVILFAAATGRFRLHAVPRTVRHLLGALVALNLLSAIEVVEIGKAARFLMITLYLVVFAIWFAGYVDSRRRMRLAIGAYIAAAVGSALLGSLALFIGFPGSSALTAEGYRAQALFQDPNVFGPFLIPAAVILLEERLRPSLFARRPALNLICLLVLIAGILFSYSRAAWLNLVFAVAVLALFEGFRRGGARRTLRLAAAGIVIAAVTIAVVEATGSTTFLDQRAHYQAYDTSRFGTQRIGVELALAHPLGVGPGQFDVLLPVSAHSLYVRALAEQGLLGIVTMLALVLGTLALAFRDASRGRDLYGLSSVALVAAWCGLLVNSLVIDTLHWRHLWLLAALIWASAMLHRPTRLGGA